MDFLGLGQVLGAGLQFYQDKQAKKAAGKTEMIQFQLAKKQLDLEIAKQAAIAEQARVAGATAQAAPRGASSSKKSAMMSGELPSWLVPVAVAGVAAFVLMRK